MPKRLAAVSTAAVLFGALAVLLVWRADRLSESRPLKGLRPEGAARIELERQDRPPIVLERQAGQWRLRAPDDLASARICAELLAGLAGLEIGTEVSGDPSSYAAYDLQEASATHVKVYSQASAAPQLDGWFGRPALGEGTLYFRRAREKPVFIATGVDPDLLRRSAEKYREHAFFSFPNGVGAIQWVQLSSSGKSTSLKRDTPGWTTAIGLQVADFVDASDAETGLARPALVVEASGLTQKSRWLIGNVKREKKGKDVYRYARSDDRPGVVALVAVYDVDALLKALK